MKVPVDLIEPGTRLRGVDAEHVAALIASIEEVGLLSPITVYQRPVMQAGINVTGFGLVAGLHRLEACRSLGFEEIEAVVVDLSDLKRQIAECDENLCGANLTPAERARFTSRRKQAYEALHPETRHGAGLNGGLNTSRQVGDTSRFTKDTASRTGKSERAVQRDATRGDRIDGDVLAKIAGTDMDKGKVLDALAAVPKDQQADELAKYRSAEKARREVADRNEAHDLNRQQDRSIALTEAQQFAEWLLARTDLNDLPVLISWLEGTKPRDVIAALRREAA